MPIEILARRGQMSYMMSMTPGMLNAMSKKLKNKYLTQQTINNFKIKCRKEIT